MIFLQIFELALKQAPRLRVDCNNDRFSCNAESNLDRATPQELNETAVCLNSSLDYR